MTEFSAWLERLKALPRVVIQAHNFPDHDAVAAAWALGHLLQTQGISYLLVYDGLIDRISLHNMIEWLEIPMIPLSQAALSPDDKVVIVDGCSGEKNVANATGEEIAVIDHHRVAAPARLWFCDIRPEVGATVSIVFDYYRQLGVEIPPRIATAMQVGLAIDTANLTRGFGTLDIEAFAALHQRADVGLANRITRNSIKAHELKFYQGVLDNHLIEQRVLYGWVDHGCPKNMLGVLGDFMLSIDEVDATVLVAPAPEVLHLSLRAEHDKLNVASWVGEVLHSRGVGFGGGHRHMAGGIIERARFEGELTADLIFGWFQASRDRHG